MWKSCVWASYPSKNTPQLMPMSGPFSSMWEKELKMSPLNEGYPLLHCFHFGIAKPDHDVSESEAEGWWKRVQLSHRLGPVLFQIWSKPSDFSANMFFPTKITLQSWKFLILRPAEDVRKRAHQGRQEDPGRYRRVRDPEMGWFHQKTWGITMKNGFQHFS